MKFITKVLLIMLLNGGIILTSCQQDNSPANTYSNKPNGTNEPAAPEPSDKISVPSGISLSPEAEQISILLDKGSYNAADTLFNNYIPQKPNDATLYCQYVRFLIEGYALAEDPYISTPLKTDDKYKSSGVIGQAIVLASEFDPKVKPYLADIILKSLYDQVYKKSAAGEGYINSSGEMISDNDIFGLAPTNKILFAWKAIELDATIGKKWADKYERLVPVFVRLGMPTSSMWTANLSGDLSNGADKNSDVDFERATQGFLDALDSRKCKVDKINDASTIYAKVFADDIKKAFSNRNSSYLKLVNAIKREGGNLKMFEDKGVLPSSLMSNSNNKDDVEDTDKIVTLNSSNLLGTWEGTFGSNNTPSNIKIDKIEGDTFYGVLNTQSAQIAFTGSMNANTREITFNETKVISQGNTKNWKLGKNKGIFSNNGKMIKGKGEDGRSSYSWKFLKQ